MCIVACCHETCDRSEVVINFAWSCHRLDKGEAVRPYVTCMCQVMGPCAVDYRPLTELASYSPPVPREEQTRHFLHSFVCLQWGGGGKGVTALENIADHV